MKSEAVYYFIELLATLAPCYGLLLSEQSRSKGFLEYQPLIWIAE
ncbi:MAG: hypothetical protein AABZ02_07435 [Bacteroidota bacterium]